MDISIIIVNYRGWKALDECLESLTKISESQHSFEVIVIDNFSNDGQLPNFQVKYPQFIFKENTGNNGFSNGCNTGASMAKGNHFLFLNPDTKLTTAALTVLVETEIAKPEIGILSCLQINENDKYYKQNNLFPAAGRFFGISRSIYRKLNSNALKNRFQNTNELFYPDWVTGAVVMISRSWFERINGWNEDYWLYFEDVDLCKKAVKMGAKIAVTRKATIFHQHGGASRLNVVTKALTKTEVIISKHTYISNEFAGFTKSYFQFILVVSVLLEKSILSLFSLVLFFVPKLKVHRLMLRNLTMYYKHVLQNKTWISPRAMNFKRKIVL
ncbi:glycosyltransferase family 2 protein [Flavobacterium turcicum]|uniref:Glycosyltransferase family 2 protein n=1 Tax=Flavobacterium turcicum TaxID=2764718 RepID=A0ABR7JFN8_9FLAO|nr:glycosyltransferase family 2 protein [Flavobacterium turcicum]MBC5863272.1 glycosyltransferase family 2 protein [Flavobacterium turcicum]NHL02004.1 glycosyltransferase family 2 protein [Flavobacterium turcicum]